MKINELVQSLYRVRMLYITTCVYSMAGVPLTTSNVLAVVREVERWWGREGGGSLTGWLYIPESKQKEIMANFPDEKDQKQQAITLDAHARRGLPLRPSTQHSLKTHSYILLANYPQYSPFHTKLPCHTTSLS